MASPEWAQRQRDFQVAVVLGGAEPPPLAVRPYSVWVLGDDAAAGPRRGPAALAVLAATIASCAVVVGLLVGLVAGADTGTTAGLATFVALGMGLAFATIMTQRSWTTQVFPGPGSHVVIEAEDRLWVVPIGSDDAALLDDAGEVAVIGSLESDGTMGLVLGDRMVWPTGPPISAA